MLGNTEKRNWRSSILYVFLPDCMLPNVWSGLGEWLEKWGLVWDCKSLIHVVMGKAESTVLGYDLPGTD